MELEEHILERVGNWDRLSRWEKSGLGRDMRRAGLSYGEIMEMIDVKKSTLATWCRDVRLGPEQIAAIKDRTGSVKGIPRDTNRKRRLEIQRIRAKSHQQIPTLLGNPLWLAGTVMYWAEGSKTRNQLSMANTDPRILRIFIAWINQFVHATPEYRLALHLHQGNDDQQAKDHWRDVLDLEDVEFHKTYIKPRGTGHRKSVHVAGVCTVRVMRPADAWQRVMAWIEGLTEHLDLDE
jgi:hypothetical protein